jgi:hypothetical protein
MKPELSNRNLFNAQVFVTPVLDQIAEPPQAAPSYCARCGSGMLLLEKAARLCQCTPRMQYRSRRAGKAAFLRTGGWQRAGVRPDAGRAGK